MLSGLRSTHGAVIPSQRQPFSVSRPTHVPAPSTQPHEQQQQQRRHQRQVRKNRIRRSVIAESGIEGFLGLGSLLKPEVAAVFSAVMAAGSVGLNYYGGLLTESKRVELQKELDRERQAESVLQELASIISRYRGPLLESSVDLEQRLWHLATMTGEWYETKDVLCGEEIAYTLFTLAQFLGFLEVVRREGPRERSFLAAGNPQGSDTLATLVEGFRFVLCASPATLQEWLGEPDEERDHPGARQRRAYTPKKGKRKAMMEGLGEGPGSLSIPLRVSRGAQRAIGSKMGATPLGAERHYTHSYATFLAKLKAEPDFACWLQAIETDLAALLTGPSWMGESNSTPHRWTRVLLMQQLLVDAIDLLDPDYVRVPVNRRIRLSPVAYAPLPNVEQYTAALTLLSGPMDTARFGHKGPNNEEHFQALQNLLHPERVVEAANQVRRAQQSSQNGGTTSNRATGSFSAGNSKSGSPLSTTADDDSPTSSTSGSSSSKVPSILPSFNLLPSVGATGVQLLQQLSGQGQQQQPQQQPQQVEGPGKQAPPPADPAATAAAAGGGTTSSGSDFGGTAVTAQPPALSSRSGSPTTAVRNGKKNA